MQLDRTALGSESTTPKLTSNAHFDALLSEGPSLPISGEVATNPLSPPTVTATPSAEEANSKTEASFRESMSAFLTRIGQSAQTFFGNLHSPFRGGFGDVLDFSSGTSLEIEENDTSLSVAARSTPLLLGHYSAEYLYQRMLSSGIAARLAHLGYTQLRVFIDTSDAFVHRVVLSDDTLLRAYPSASPGHQTPRSGTTGAATAPSPNAPPDFHTPLVRNSTLTICGMYPTQACFKRKC